MIEIRLLAFSRRSLPIPTIADNGKFRKIKFEPLASMGRIRPARPRGMIPVGQGVRVKLQLIQKNLSSTLRVEEGVRVPIPRLPTDPQTGVSRQRGPFPCTES